MQLEQTLGMYQPIQTQIAQERSRSYTVFNLEFLSASVLYTGDSGSLGSAVPTSRGFIVPLGNMDIPRIKDIHDTYLVDGEGNVSNGHTTVVSDNGTTRISHEE